MTDKTAALHAAAFLDSTEARSIDAIRASDLRRGVIALIECLIDDLGVDPTRTEGDDATRLMSEALPRRFGVGDDLAPRMPEIVRAFFQHLAADAMVPSAFEIDIALATIDADDFVAAVKSVPYGQRVGGRGGTVKGRGRKVGRNDPCPCGSGRKFKQCCARL